MPQPKGLIPNLMLSELLSQLSSVRRSNLAQTNTTSQLQQLQMQLQMERQQAQMARQQLERMPRRQATGASSATVVGAGGGLQTHFTVSLDAVSSSPSAAPASSSRPQFLLSRQVWGWGVIEYFFIKRRVLLLLYFKINSPLKGINMSRKLFIRGYY